MKQLKKTLLTLVALLALTTQAWAAETLLLTIESTDYTSFKSGSMTFDDKVTVTFSNSVENSGNNSGWYATFTESLLTVAGINGYTITSCKFYTNEGVASTGYTVEGESPSVYLTSGKVYNDDNRSVKIGESGVTKIEVYGAAASSATAVDIAWNKTTKTGTFTQPAGNVTVSVEYFPQAALTAVPTAINDVPATTDGAIVKVGTVANIGSTTTAQGTVMYYASQTALDDDALLALDADQWKADVPTAESLAEGRAYVYYYVRGNDSDTDEENFSDGDILAANALNVTIAAEPTYAVTFADGVNPEPPAEPEWTASPNADVKKGQTVTVTYTGTRKVIGVKAEKKAGNTYQKWDANQKELVATEFPAEVTMVEDANQNVTWSAGTYVVENDVTINGTITLDGNVELIIKDGAKLTVTNNQIAGNDNNLSIYGQANQTGQLVVNFSNGNAFNNLPTLEVHSCQVTATSSGDGCSGFYDIQTFNVYGGSVDAEKTGTSGYGIFFASNASMNIYGGDVKAVGKGESYGITGLGAPVTVYGGKLWAECAGYKALYAVELQKGEGFTGKIETSDNGSSWTEYTEDGTPGTKYVRVGY